MDLLGAPFRALPNLYRCIITKQIQNTESFSIQRDLYKTVVHKCHDSILSGLVPLIANR